MSSPLPTPLKFMMPGWYAVVMGLCGLALAWHRAVPLMGEMAGAVALVVGGFAALVFVVLAVATVVRGRRYPEAWAEDRRHPVRHTFIAALPIGATPWLPRRRPRPSARSRDRHVRARPGPPAIRSPPGAHRLRCPCG